MSIYDKILSQFYNTSLGLYKLDDFYIYKDVDTFGVGIINENEILIDETLANVEIKDFSFQINETDKINLILLSSSLKTHKNEFATFCTHFIEKGKNNENRKLLLSEPHKWWNNWRELIGNKLHKIEPYDVLAELLALEIISNKETDIIWGGPQGSSIDITTKETYYEVKSSVVRFENEISISSQYQLDESNLSKKYKLVYIKMEKLNGGETINKSLERIRKKSNLDYEAIEKELHQKGFRKNSSSRNISYVILEMRLYDVDDNFPKITKESFKDDKIPENIKKITYMVSLEGIKYNKMDW